VCAVDGECTDLDAASFECFDVIVKDCFEDAVLIFGFLPLTVGNMQLFGIGFGCGGYDLVASVGTAFFIVCVVVPGG